MGMSASQARYLSLIAQQSDLEFQGQQINESRTTLSEQTNSLYGQLQNLSVPTPPHTSDFTTIEYTGALGADTFKIGNIVPSGSSYSLNLETIRQGNSTTNAGRLQIKALSETSSYVPVVTKDRAVVTAVKDNNGDVPPIGAGKTVEDGTQILHKLTKAEFNNLINSEDNIVFYKRDGETNKFIQVHNPEEADCDDGLYVVMNAENAVEDDTNTQEDETQQANYDPETDFVYQGKGSSDIKAPKPNLNDYYVMDANTKEIRKAVLSDFENDGTNITGFKSDVTYYKKGTGDDAVSGKNFDYVEGNSYSINGNTLYPAEGNELVKILGEEKRASVVEALRNGFPTETVGCETESDVLSLFYVSFSQEGNLWVPHFVLRNDVTEDTVQAGQCWANMYDLTTAGTYTQLDTYDNAFLTFDTAGRIISISIPIKDPVSGETIYQDLEVSAKTVTDSEAYEDAYNDYEYEKYKYDQEQLKINNQMSIIQAEDKKLELKLQRLDNERKQITTEIEALKKVIQENIEKSYKTFSG